MTLTIAIIGILVIAAIGIFSSRRPASNMEEWTVGGRKFGAISMWFLQAGEIYTTFTFLGMSALAYAGGAAAFYSFPYAPLGFIGLYFLGPRIWRLGKQRGYITQADFFEDIYKSRVLGWVVAVLGIVFLIPYLQLQISGLGTIIQIATGSTGSSNMSMIIAFVLTVLFVLWAGLRGIAATAYFKDAIMLIVLLIIGIAIPIHYGGSIGGMFHQIVQKFPQMMTVHQGSNNLAWFWTSIVVSMIGTMMSLPNGWPMVFGAKSERALRRNYIFLPLYQIGLLLPILIGFAGLLAVTGKVNPNAILLMLTQKAMPTWVLGVTVVGGIAAAMVPAAGLLVAITSTFSKNVIRTSNEKSTFYVNQVTVVVVTAIALVCAISAPTLLANLLLLTFSGLAQLAPGIFAGVYMGKSRPRASTLLAGILVGVLVVAYLTFAHVQLNGVNAGLIGLIVNVVVVIVTEGIVRTIKGESTKVS